MAAAMPSCTSGVVGTLAFAKGRPASASMTIASVLVPPTSTPSSRSEEGIGRLRGEQGVTDVIAERGGPDDREPGLRAPYLRAWRRDHGDALAEAQTLRHERSTGVGGQHGDDVGDPGSHTALLEGEQELVLELDPELASGVAAAAHHGRRALHEAAVGMPPDLDDLAFDQHARAERIGQRGDRPAPGRRGDRLAQPERTADRAAD